jgi:hypothetical protein
VTPGIAESLSHFRIGRDPEDFALMVSANQGDVNRSGCCGRSSASQEWRLMFSTQAVSLCALWSG